MIVAQLRTARELLWRPAGHTEPTGEVPMRCTMPANAFTSRRVFLDGIRPLEGRIVLGAASNGQCGFHAVDSIPWTGEQRAGSYALKCARGQRKSSKGRRTGQWSPLQRERERNSKRKIQRELQKPVLLGQHTAVQLVLIYWIIVPRSLLVPII